MKVIKRIIFFALVPAMLCLWTASEFQSPAVPVEVSCDGLEERRKIPQDDADAIVNDHGEWLNSGLATQEQTSPVNFRNADLRGVDLSGEHLTRMDFFNADLSSANLAKATLELATFTCATLNNAKFTDSNLQRAVLRNTQLTNADLQDADLQGANFMLANLTGTIVTDAKLTNIILNHSTYAPVGLPSADYVVGIEGLDTVIIPEGKQVGMVKLREMFRKAGLRGLEREATFRIESNEARNDRRYGRLYEKADGWFRWLLFELTTEWGRRPGRALWLLGVLWWLCSVFYSVTIWRSVSSPDNGVLKVYTNERLIPWTAEVIGSDTGAEAISAKGLEAYEWGLYFSLLSAFHFGWRDLNVGEWIARMQRKEFLLRGCGWVRVVSGVQAIISVFFLAVWALTYFGRPFQ